MAKHSDYMIEEESDKPIDFKYYFFIFKKNFSVVLTFLIITVTLAIIAASKITSQYQAFSQVILERPEGPRSQERVFEEGFEATSWTEDYYNTQVEIMKSETVMRQVVETLKLQDYFDNDNEEAVASMIQGMMSVTRAGTSRIFNIVVTADDPQLVANLANGIARAYIRKNFENSLYYSREILTWLPQQGDSGVITVQDPFGGMRQVKRDELIESLPAIQSDQTLRDLRAKIASQESELELLLKQYKEKHPLVVKARANLKFLAESVEDEKKRIIENLKSEAEGQHKLGTARIIEEAKVPKTPLPTKRLNIILTAAIAELIISFLIFVLIDFFDHTVRSVEDFERRGLALPFLGQLPLIKKKDWEAEDGALVVYKGKHPEIVEAFRYVRVAINFSGPPESIKTLAFASCLPHEGKSFTTHNIAASLAKDGNKTLIIDADLRRPVLHKTFRTENSVGLSNFLTSNLEFDAVVKESFVENLSLIVSGPLSPNPGEILGSQRMKLLLEEARKKFDRIIIDCPPLTGIGDGYVVGSLLGQLIMVIASGKTPSDLIKHTLHQLDKAQVKVLGTILNMVDMEKERLSGYSKHYHHTYTRYYQPQDTN